MRGQAVGFIAQSERLIPPVRREGAPIGSDPVATDVRRWIFATHDAPDPLRHRGGYFAISLLGYLRLCRRSGGVRRMPRGCARVRKAVWPVPPHPDPLPEEREDRRSVPKIPDLLVPESGGRRFSLSRRERAGVRGKPTSSKAAFSWTEASNHHPKGWRASSHSFSQASGFAGGC